MTPIQRTIAALRKLRELHAGQGRVPISAVSMLIAEIESETETETPIDAPHQAAPPFASSRGPTLEWKFNHHGYPHGLARP